MSIFTEIEIKTNINKLYHDLSDKNKTLFDIFLRSYLLQFEVKPEFDNLNYSDEQLIKAFDEIIQKVIE